MSSSDAQPPLSRRQARERERAANAGAQPAVPPPSVVPTSAVAAETERRRPGSHVAPASAAPAQSGVPALPPASATEIVPGSGGLTRRQMRQLREAQEQAVRPVPLQNPTPQSSDRTVEDVIGSVQDVEQHGTTGSAPASAPSGSGTETPTPTAAPRTASTPSWAPSTPTGAMSTIPDTSEAEGHGAGAAPTGEHVTEEHVAEEHVGDAHVSDEHVGDESVTAEQHADEDREDDQPVAPLAPTGFTPSTAVPTSAAEPEELDPAAVEQATSADGSPDAIEPLGQAAAHAEEPRVHRSTWAPPADGDAAPAADATTPEVFPLSLDEDDTNEVPVVRPGADGGPAQAEPKPVTTAFDAPAGHWSQQDADHHDAEVHDPDTGERRVATANTSAIIMPNSALSDVTGALNATGEVIITGSIDLPKSLSSTGSHRPIDGAEVDRLLEQQDEQPETDASPVRASRAVSSHTSTRQVVLAAAKPKESKAPLILGVTAGGLGIAAIAVVVVALVTTHVFG